MSNKVFILPSCSIKFSGKWGKVKKVDYSRGLPHLIQFEENGLLYGFFENEFLSVEQFKNWFTTGKPFYTNDSKKVLASFSGNGLLTKEGISCSIFESYPITFCPDCGEESTNIFDICDNCLEEEQHG